MMRKPIIAGNWKMNKSYSEAMTFTREVNQKIPSEDVMDTVICAPAIFLKGMEERAEDTPLQMGAQTMHFENSGAFTGEISPKSLADIGISFVIIGHSERREMFNETDETVNKKMHAAFREDLTPIMCCGETLNQKEEGFTEKVVSEQVTKGFNGLSKEQAKRAIVAYEPIWAIGTGRTSSPEDANKTCGLIRQVIEQLYDNETAQSVRIQYGGSVKPENISSLMEKEHIDGALVGGASLQADSFLAIIEGAKV
ncbi:triosephosphate isomerase [Alteribacillus iranensis]|uniref:Triosephosphate isomerase n=2 Tax=Alteribacillus iranensis TaxID=930128 RepID=A0A1I2ELA1_9BACI|nr:triosephosphate isomerase [Alteribacillus iranensis]